MLLSTSAEFNSKKSRFLEEQGARGLLTNIGIRTPLSQIPFLVSTLF